MFLFPHTRRLLSSLSPAALRTLTPLSSFSPSSVRPVNTQTHESTRRWKTTHTQGESIHHTHHHEDLFAHQKTLPSLPLPTLHDSCQRFLKSAEPLVDDVEGLKDVVSKFVSEGEGLHEELERIKQENAEGSWVSGFWESMYLEDRSPLPINTNPFFVFNKFEGETDQIVLLASLIRSVASLHQRIRSRQFAPDVVGNTHFCSYQYPRIFSSARIPGATRDTYVSTPTANHVVLNVAGHFFAFHVLTDTGDVISQALCEKVIKKCAKDILDHGMVSARNGSIPFLTALPRPDWAKGRSELESSSEQNADIFRIIDGAIAMFTFSDIDPSSSEEAAVETHVNTSGWFDKQQFIVYRNGQLAVNMEHTAVDGHTMLRCFDDMLAQLKKGVIGNTADDASFSKLAKPFYLDWDIPDDPQFEELLDGAEQHFTELKSSISSNFVDFRVFGADWIKSVGISPDAFVQICFQLAHFRMYGKVVSTYESVNMKRYRLGRTETGRSLTSPMKRFLYAMTDILASPEEKVAALRDAGKAHVEQLASCQRGEGFDRHLWSLQKVAMMRQNRLNNYELPEFFSHESYLTMRNIILSTSNCSTHGMESFGFGPVSPQGFGLGYGIEKSRIMVYITSFADPQLGGERADLFGMHLTQSLRDCFALLEKTKSLLK